MSPESEIPERRAAQGPLEVVFRPFRREDMDPLYFLDQRCAPPEGRIAYNRLLTALLESDVTALVAAEATEERPQPLLGSLILRGDAARGALDVLLLMVDPPYRRLGLARRLMDWAARLGRGNGLREIAAIEEGDGTDSAAFLEALGFRRSQETAPGFRQPEPRPRWTLALEAPPAAAPAGEEKPAAKSDGGEAAQAATSGDADGGGPADGGNDPGGGDWGAP